MKTIIVISITGIVLLLACFSYFFFLPSIEKSEVGYSYSGDDCDTLVYKNVGWAICYKDNAIVETVRHGNLYEVTASVPKDTYDYVEVYNGMDRGLIGTYEGVLYFDIKARCV